ncbi:hypothetical protein K9M42_02335 [Patescibacteria group bacterium]|nr:hypothetical protein [Patescibacteria group bacterium]
MDIQTFFYYIASVAMGFFIILCISILFIIRKTSGKLDKMLDGTKEKIEKTIDGLGSLIFKVDLIKEAIEGIANINFKRKKIQEGKKYDRINENKKEKKEN